MVQDTKDHSPEKPGLLKIIASILAAGFGVQSSRNRERDFKHGKRSYYIIGGLVFTLAFIMCLVMTVNLVLTRAGF
jgi:hypothetical protein